MGLWRQKHDCTRLAGRVALEAQTGAIPVHLVDATTGIVYEPKCQHEGKPCRRRTRSTALVQYRPCRCRLVKVGTAKELHISLRRLTCSAGPADKEQ